MFSRIEDNYGPTSRGVSFAGIVVALLLISPGAIELSWGAEGVALKIRAPEVGAPPTPPAAPNNPDVQTSDASADLLDAAVAMSQEFTASSASAAENATENGTEGTDESAAHSHVEDESALEAAEVDASSWTEDIAPAGKPSSDIVELSVQPNSDPLLPVDRPAWVGADPDYSRDVHRLFVGSTAVSDPDKADEALDAPLVKAIRKYLNDQVLDAPAAANDLAIRSSFVRSNMVADPAGYLLELNTAGQPTYQKWVTLEITPEQRAYFLSQYREVEQLNRIVPLGIGLAAVLGFVGLSHLVLRRKHGMAAAQPLTGSDLIPNESANIPRNAPKSSSGIGGFFAIVALLLMGGGLFMVVMFGAVSRVEHMDHGPKEVILEHVTSHINDHIQKIEKTDSGSVVITSRQSSDEPELVIITGGQEVIQKVTRP